MKFLHTADIHLGSKLDSKFPREVANVRKEELRSTFLRMVNYAVEQHVQAIILAGDVFDGDTPTLRDRDFFYGVVKSTPDIDFLYLKGNHDTAAYVQEELPNLKTFGTQWTKYRYGNVVVAGAELTEENAASVYSTLQLEEADLNIVVLHGQAGDSSGKDRVNLPRLRDKHIDYLALGHVHKPRFGRLDQRGQFAYSGCLEGRGFDEPGEHGFVLLQTNGIVTPTFVPFACRTVEECDVDISGVNDGYTAFLRVKQQVQFVPGNIYRINLVGELDADVDVSESDVARYLADMCFFADVKDKTGRRFDVAAYRDDMSLRGEFVRTVWAREDLDEEQKSRIAAIGLRALKGGDIDL